MSISSNNKRIAKNTVFMYIRMLFIMIVSLYTVRVVLQALGEIDYGINNVVGGVVSMFSFISTTLAGASMRFFSYEIGRNNYQKLRQYFSVTFWCYVVLVVIIVLLAETIGLWFVQNKLVIPAERMPAAMVVYQCSIAGAVVSFLAIPYNSLILAKEKMGIYAYAGIAEAALKLLVAYLLVSTGSMDKLILYAILVLVVSIMISGFYVVYDLIKFKESRISAYWDNSIFKDVFSYSSWSLFGAVSLVFRSQGINILLNIFFGPIVNTARAIAYQISNAINTFVNGFTQAVRPQQTKYYASGDQSSMLTLTYRATRICFFLIMTLSLPVLFETNFVLSLWLGKIPDYTVLFTRLVIGVSIIEAITTPLKGLISSTGNIKYTQIINSIILISVFPISWGLFRLGLPAATTMVVSLIATFCCHIVRIVISCRLTEMRFGDYFKETFVPILIVASLSIAATTFAYLTLYSETWFSFMIVSSISVASSIIFTVLFGLKTSERNLIMSTIRKKLQSRL